MIEDFIYLWFKSSQANTNFSFHFHMLFILSSKALEVSPSAQFVS